MKKIQELLAAQRELATKMADAQGENLAALEREYNANKREIELLNQEAAATRMSRENRGEEFRAFLREKKAGSNFELHREAIAGMTTTDVTKSIRPHTVGVLDKDLTDACIYTQAGCPVVSGAAGINDWLYVGNATVKIANELTPLGDAQKLALDNKSAVQNRMSAKIVISNQAIENSELNLEALALQKIDAAYQEAINFAATSSAKYGANFYGGFAHADKQTYTYANTGFKYADAMAMVAKVAKENLPVRFGCFVMGADDFYAMKATSRDNGSGLMVIDDNNRLGGFPVFVTEAINRATVKGAINGNNIGFGLFNYLPCLQHGSVRLSIDANSSDAADVDGVIITCNTDWSMTDLYPKAFVLAGKGAAA